jgi:hypothetical protein
VQARGSLKRFGLIGLSPCTSLRSENPAGRRTPTSSPRSTQAACSTPSYATATTSPLTVRYSPVPQQVGEGCFGRSCASDPKRRETPRGPRPDRRRRPRHTPRRYIHRMEEGFGGWKAEPESRRGRPDHRRSELAGQRRQDAHRAGSEDGLAVADGQTADGRTAGIGDEVVIRQNECQLPTGKGSSRTGTAGPSHQYLPAPAIVVCRANSVRPRLRQQRSYKPYGHDPRETPTGTPE